MDLIIQYLNKQGKTEGLIATDPPHPNLGLIIVIPAYKEPNIQATIESLYKCTLPSCAVEIIVLINSKVEEAEDVRSVNKICYDTSVEIRDRLSIPLLSMQVLEEYEMSTKKGGVGLARKILMDEACFRLIATSRKGGIISNLDADCLVSVNYLVVLEKWFTANPKLSATSIHFEHILDGIPIIQYELHLRYFIGMQRVLDLPFAFQTVGSAMAVRAKDYAAAGGMNTRKAGEDFYFLHKFIKNDRCGDLDSAVVFPSGRVSDRVPFGTGRAVGEIRERSNYSTYNPESFFIIKKFTDNVREFYDEKIVDLPDVMEHYLVSIDFSTALAEIRENTRDYAAFRKRFFQFFDAFRLMKCLHFLRDNGFLDLRLEEALPVYFEKIDIEYSDSFRINLDKLRKYDLN